MRRTTASRPCSSSPWPRCSSSSPRSSRRSLPSPWTVSAPASAADLSALTAGQASLCGPVTACARARALADRVGAGVTSCRLHGDVAVVVAEVRPWGPLGRLGIATSQARVGPGTSLRGPVGHPDFLPLR